MLCCQKEAYPVPLSMTNERRNKTVSSDRIIADNCVGSLYSYWMVVSAKYRWDERNYDLIFRLCVALTNVLVEMHPLRDDFGTAFEKYKKRLYRSGDETLNKRKSNEV